MPIQPYARVVRPRSFDPEQPSPVAQYAASLRAARANNTPGMGLLTNQQAGQLYDQSSQYSGRGYMPSTTVGGLWGQQPSIASDPVRRGLNIPGINGIPMPGQQGPVGAGIDSDIIGARFANMPLYGQVSPGSQNRAVLGRKYNYDPSIPEAGLPGRLQPTPEHRAQLVQRGLLDQPEPTPDVMAGRRAATAKARAEERAYRRGNVERFGFQQRDARRLRRGNLTFEERLQAGLPGYAVEQIRQHGLAGIAGIQAGGRVREAEIGAEAGKGLLGLKEKELGLKGQEIAANRRRDDMMLAEQYRQAAQAAGASGNVDEYNRNMAIADRIMGAIPIPPIPEPTYSGPLPAGILPPSNTPYTPPRVAGPTPQPGSQDADFMDGLRGYADAAGGMGTGIPLPQPSGTPAIAAPGLPQQSPPANAGLPGVNVPQRWGQIPQQIRTAIKGQSAQEMVGNLMNAYPDMPQQIADEMIQAAYPGTTVTMYNPDGYGVSDFLGGLTGVENFFRWGRMANPKLPQPPSGFVWPGIPGAIQSYVGG